MAGIKSFGVVVPAYRLKRETLARAWGKGGGKGEKAVCNFDEDTVTMAVEASFSCFENMSVQRSAPSALYFASTSSPYAEKQSASFLAYALEFPKEASVVDVSGSFAASTQALKLALDFVKGTKKDALVVASDMPSASYNTENEKSFGDGACALLIGEDDALFEIEDAVSMQQDFLDMWQKSGDKYIQDGDSSFTTQYGFSKIVKEAVLFFLEKNKLKTEDVRKFVFPAPSFKEYQNVAKSLKLHETQFVPDGLFYATGFTGCASPFLCLTQVIQEVKSGDAVVLCGYGSGSCDVFLLRAKKSISKSAKGIHDALKNKLEIQSYEKYLRFKNILKEELLKPFSSQAMQWREKKQNLQLYGVECKSCGHVYFPMKRVCVSCGAKDNFTEKKLFRGGVLYAFTKDILYPTPNPPNITGCADLNGCGRFYGQLTDVNPDDVKIGMPVRLVLRKFHEGGGFYNYFWKITPENQRTGSGG